MASVSVWCQFADGDRIGVRVKAETSFPDALAQARAEALTAFKGAVREVMDVQVEDE
jgi:hypothetical protein